MVLQGEYTVTVGGKERHFKLGTLSDNLFCQYENIKLSEYRERITNPVAFTQINLIYSQAVAYAKVHKQPVDFTIEDVSVWIDEVGEHVFMDEIVKIANAHISKNLKAPASQPGQDGNGMSVTSSVSQSVN